jgi:hypothetical protein
MLVRKQMELLQMKMRKQWNVEEPIYVIPCKKNLKNILCKP